MLDAHDSTAHTISAWLAHREIHDHRARSTGVHRLPRPAVRPWKSSPSGPGSLPGVIERMQHHGDSLLPPGWDPGPHRALRDPDAGDRLWCSGRHKASHAPTSRCPLTTPAIQCRPARSSRAQAHGITAARHHAPPALCKTTAHGLPTLADKGYTAAGTGIHTPIKSAKPCPKVSKP